MPSSGCGLCLRTGDVLSVVHLGVTLPCCLSVQSLMGPVIWLRSWFDCCARWNWIQQILDPSLYQIASVLFGHFWGPTVAKDLRPASMKWFVYSIFASWNIDISRRCLSFSIWPLMMTKLYEGSNLIIVCVSGNSRAVMSVPLLLQLITATVPQFFHRLLSSATNQFMHELGVWIVEFFLWSLDPSTAIPGIKVIRQKSHQKGRRNFGPRQDSTRRSRCLVGGESLALENLHRCATRRVSLTMAARATSSIICGVDGQLGHKVGDQLGAVDIWCCIWQLPDRLCRRSGCLP